MDPRCTPDRSQMGPRQALERPFPRPEKNSFLRPGRLLSALEGKPGPLFARPGKQLGTSSPLRKKSLGPFLCPGEKSRAISLRPEAKAWAAFPAVEQKPGTLPLPRKRSPGRASFPPAEKTSGPFSPLHTKNGPLLLPRKICPGSFQRSSLGHAVSKGL